MITASDTALLRLFLADPAGNDEVFHDDMLEQLWDDNDEDIYSAAADGWRAKAAKAHELYTAQIDGSLLSRDQIWYHCIRMAEHFDKMSGGTLANVLMQTNYDVADSSYEY